MKEKLFDVFVNSNIMLCIRVKAKDSKEAIEKAQEGDRIDITECDGSNDWDSAEAEEVKE